MSTVADKLKAAPSLVPGKGCDTCRHLWGAHIVTPGYLRCMAVGGNDAREVYPMLCKGNLWESSPPFVPVLVRFKRWLLG